MNTESCIIVTSDGCKDTVIDALRREQDRLNKDLRRVNSSIKKLEKEIADITLYLERHTKE